MIKIDYNGIKIECETIEQAKELIAALGGKREVQPKLPQPTIIEDIKKAIEEAPVIRPRYPWIRPHQEPVWLGVASPCFEVVC